jgi:hypothetical protein
MAGVLAMFLVSTPTSPVVNAYSCSSSSSTPHTNNIRPQTGVSGSSGSCSTSSSASSRTFPPTIGAISHSIGNGPISQSSTSEAFSFPPPTFELGVSSLAGGAQSSCSSSSASSTTLQFGGLVGPGLSLSSSSTSKPGTCP